MIYILIRRAAAVFSALFICAALMPRVSASQQPEAQPSGDYLCYTVSIKKPAGETLSFAFTRLKALDYIIQPGDILEYDVYLASDSSGLGAVDGEIDGLGRSMRDNGFVDQNGQGIHPGMDTRAYALGKWWHRSISIALDEQSASDASHATIGKKLKEIQLAVHPDSSDYSELEAVVYYDNIVITNGGEEKLVIFKDASDFDASKVSTNNKKNITGAEIVLKTLSSEEEAALEQEKQSELEAQRLAQEEKLNKKLEGKAAREQAALGTTASGSGEDGLTDDSKAISTKEEVSVRAEVGLLNILNEYSLVTIISVAAVCVLIIGAVIYIVSKNK